MSRKRQQRKARQRAREAKPPEELREELDDEEVEATKDEEGLGYKTETEIRAEELAIDVPFEAVPRTREKRERIVYADGESLSEYLDRTTDRKVRRKRASKP